MGRGLATVIMMAVTLTGCSPKRVLRTDTATQTLPAEDGLSSGTSPVNTSGHPPGEPAGGLPEPQSKGASGTSSLDMAGASPPGKPATQLLTGSRLGLEAAALAKQQIGKPYQWGAEGPDKFDCSGLTMYVYNELGVQLPRVSGQQAYAGVHVDREDLQPGDLVFFKLNGSRIDHVGIYQGHGNFVHAPSKHMPVRTDSLNDSYWRRRFKGGRRLK